MAGYALPFAVRHFGPCVGEAFIGIDRLAGWIGALASEVSDGDRGVAEDHHPITLTDEVLRIGTSRGLILLLSSWKATSRE